LSNESKVEYIAELRKILHNVFVESSDEKPKDEKFLRPPIIRASMAVAEIEERFFPNPLVNHCGTGGLSFFRRPILPHT